MISNYDNFHGDEHYLDNYDDEQYYRLCDELYQQWQEDQLDNKEK